MPRVRSRCFDNFHEKTIDSRLSQNKLSQLLQYLNELVHPKLLLYWLLIIESSTPHIDP